MEHTIQRMVSLYPELHSFVKVVPNLSPKLRKVILLNNVDVPIDDYVM